ncbi:GNAT family N-acetyltransferase [Flavihumibacter profundi]|uniref:GNAT family N-acetyltransferase n=1 Tax=Flavihumibacter profundi TaxID=2716883 RepID=UPI001CC82478|nr:GNAT family N-acetyltransferase [Flavihumibacter profundi]MBZ5856264.1 GNAT family N-acetyltransferase [Flavihumibacter profundi]
MAIVKPAGFESALQIAGLSRQTFYDTFADSNTKADTDLFMDTQFSSEILEAEFRQPGNFFFIALDDGEPIGYMKIKQHPESHPDCIKVLPSIELCRLYVVKTVIATGIGKLLMDYALNWAKEGGLKSTWLGVWENNERAIKFYLKNGFEKVGSHGFMLGNDLQTDWLMVRNL